MASNSPEYLWLIQETAYGVQTASSVVGTSRFLVPLVDSNSFSVVEDPMIVETPRGGGLDVVADAQADFHEVKGSLSTLGYPALAAFLMNAGLTRINAAQTSPWTTTEPILDLASITAWHVFRGRDGTLVKRQYIGGKILSVNGSISRQDPRLKLKFDLQFSKELPNPIDSSAIGTAPADPTEAQYPLGPYLFSHTAGNIMLGGSALTKYDELDFTITNKSDPKAFETHWVTDLVVTGREITSNVNLLLRSSTDLRSSYLSLTSQGYSVEFNNGTNTLILNFGANTHINKLPYDMPLGKVFMQKATFRPKWDPALLSGAGSDVVVTNT